jgi:leader peptidase (prepilin peptidase)/N-methyltransferase
VSTVLIFALAGAFTGYTGCRILTFTGIAVPAACRAVAAVAAAVLWAFVAWRWWPGRWCPVPLAVGAFAVPLCVGDLRARRLPDVLTFTAYPVFALALGTAGGVPLAWHAALGATVFTGAHAVVRWRAPSSLGAGDLKLSGSLGAVLGAVGWPALVAAPVLAAAVTLALACGAALARSDRWRDGVPHGPGLLAATWLAAALAGPAST